VSAHWREVRGHPPGHPDGRLWTAEEDAALGTDTDVAVAKRLGRSAHAVNDRRRALGVPAFVTKVDGRKLRRLRERAGLLQPELAAAAGVHPRAVTNLENGWKDGVRPPVAARLAAALGCEVAAFTRTTRQ
jgi:DNA-binding XRE family transcriptional regulator